MDENMKELCNQEEVDFYHLLDYVSIAKGCAMTHTNLVMSLTKEELTVLKAALEIAGGV